MKILVATDASECSKAAINSVLKLKSQPGSEFRIIMVVDFFEPLPSLEGVKEAEIEKAREHVTEVVKKTANSLQNCKVSGDVLDGYADQMILEAAHSLKADLIIMGSHGRKGMSRFLLGSISRSVLLNAPCPVRIIRSETLKDVTEKGTYNVLIALDLTEQSDYALDHVLSTPWPESTKFKCVTVVPDEPKHMDLAESHNKTVIQHKERLKRQAVAGLERSVVRLSKTLGPDSASYEILEGDPREAIIGAADFWPADLIVMGSHGRKLVERLMVGSVSEAIAMHAPCSVEVLRIPQAATVQVPV